MAERCGIMRLIDTWYAGLARGVGGTSKILGKVHAAQVLIGGRFFTSSFTILENHKVDFLFGLDNLKWHWCCIDLRENVLTFEDGLIKVPFLKPE